MPCEPAIPLLSIYLKESKNSSSRRYKYINLMLKLKLQYIGHLTPRANTLEKSLMLGKDWGQKEKGMTEDEMTGWHHWLKWHEFEQTPGDSEGQGSLACYSPWGHKKSDTTEWVAKMFMAALFTIAKIWKQPRCPSTGEWLKMWCVYALQYYLATKWNEILPSDEPRENDA